MSDHTWRPIRVEMRLTPEEAQGLLQLVDELDPLARGLQDAIDSYRKYGRAERVLVDGLTEGGT